MYILKPELDAEATKAEIASLQNILETNGSKVVDVNAMLLHKIPMLTAVQ